MINSPAILAGIGKVKTSAAGAGLTVRCFEQEETEVAEKGKKHLFFSVLSVASCSSVLFHPPTQDGSAIFFINLRTQGAPFDRLPSTGLRATLGFGVEPLRGKSRHTECADYNYFRRRPSPRMPTIARQANAIDDGSGTMEKHCSSAKSFKLM